MERISTCLKFYLLEAGNDGSIEHVDKALIANLMTLFFAGRDTSGALLTWFFWLISKNPVVENKIIDEIRQNLAENASPKHIFSNVQELGKLVYLHSALSEALRLFPTGPFLLRVPNQKDVLPSGHKVDQKTKIMLCSYAMGRNAEIWGEDCLEFKPERWLSDKGGIKHVASNNFLAFSSGPWTCPGKELAFIRMKAVAATMIHNFHVCILDGQNIVPSISAILTMEHGLKATISSRWV
ncbi:Cytochrome [Abeliophyllum distichum]|uniref:Cytochrome n=1 Tax=Abeliophyllum distichum TaxID=126358 RepID=A0ABD1SCT9_9LAMI